MGVFRLLMCHLNHSLQEVVQGSFRVGANGVGVKFPSPMFSGSCSDLPLSSDNEKQEEVKQKRAK